MDRCEPAVLMQLPARQVQFGDAAARHARQATAALLSSSPSCRLDSFSLPSSTQLGLFSFSFFLSFLPFSSFYTSNVPADFRAKRQPDRRLYRNAAEVDKQATSLRGEHGCCCCSALGANSKFGSTECLL